MIPLKDLSKRFACAAWLLSLTMLSGCIASDDALFKTSTNPMRAGRYDVQYLVDGRWTTYGAGSLTLVGGKYNWAEDQGGGVAPELETQRLERHARRYRKRLFHRRRRCRRSPDPDVDRPLCVWRCAAVRESAALRFSELLGPPRVAGIVGSSNREDRNTRVPVFGQGISDARVDRLCRTYDHAEAARSRRRLKRAARPAERKPGGSRSSRSLSCVSLCRLERRGGARAHPRRVQGVGRSGWAPADADPRRGGARHRVSQSHERPGPGGEALPRGDAQPLAGCGRALTRLRRPASSPVLR